MKAILRLSPLPHILLSSIPGAAVGLKNSVWANIFGNTLGSGGHGVVLDLENNSAIIMDNNFANATYRGTGLANGQGSIQSALIANNILGEGSTFHVELPIADNSGIFLQQNEYLDASGNSVPPFLDPVGSAVHIAN